MPSPADRTAPPSAAALTAQLDELAASLRIELQERLDLIALCRALVDDPALIRDRRDFWPETTLLVPSARIDAIADLLDRIDAREV